MLMVHRYAVTVHPKTGADMTVLVCADTEREAAITVRNLLEDRNGLSEFSVAKVEHVKWVDPETGEET